MAIRPSASTQNQAFAALLFLYREVLGIPLGDLHALHAKKSTYTQPYLSHEECLRIFAHLDGPPYLVACFLYGSGLRLLEALDGISTIGPSSYAMAKGKKTTPKRF